MKTNLLLLLAVAVVCCYGGCKKVDQDPYNYYPKVRTDSAVTLPDGSVRVYGTVLSAGNTGIVTAGFCMADTANPKMMVGQMLTDTLTNSTFSATYAAKNFSSIKQYYFRAFVCNENGYAIGGDVSLTNVCFDTATISCHPTKQHLLLNGIYKEDEPYSHSEKLSQSAQEYSGWVWSSSHGIRIVFGAYPTSGVYSISPDVPGTRQVTLMVDGNMAAAGGSLYVVELQPDLIEVTICDAKVSLRLGWSSSYSTFTMATNFVLQR